jgi:hypothetical protein
MIDLSSVRYFQFKVLCDEIFVLKLPLWYIYTYTFLSAVALILICFSGRLFRRCQTPLWNIKFVIEFDLIYPFTAVRAQLALDSVCA